MLSSVSSSLKVVLAVVLVHSTATLAVREQKLIPVADQLELMRQKTGGEMDRGMDKTEACRLIPGCADVECLPPFELMREEGQCCPLCTAPPDVVVVDEHKAMMGPSPWAAPLSPTAPSGCEGAKCFIPVCKEGEEVGPFPDSCCKHCIPAAGASSARTRAVGSKIR
eukprot:gnl/MRDRNA2_/MRDRNA2_96213_c0_seq1.p1 gnl/MRDRNA2_/MRDRNA2_96213_c0~~gnl/MRDRNA2_/MRDRNA2_96213_c0_seq1.p1  ORF type:complete len:167 (-),score=32.03 gnl/MRDRNA2_/MRDRNA2_96213_c0_seq1:31-531(-)